jgi:membrane associated rhomboid family serine protease
MNGFGRGFFGLPPVVKNIIYINVLMLLATYAVQSFMGLDMNANVFYLNTKLGLYFPKSDQFMPLQIVTHMFMHGGFWHIFFNMYALFIFGGVLENVWGPKRFFIYYIICGLGAALTHETVIAFEYSHLAHSLSPENLQMVLNEGTALFKNGQGFTDPDMLKLQMLLNTTTVGASGAIFGVLLAFGVLFPNTQLMLLFPPIPIKAKYFVMIYGAIELSLAIAQPGSDIAHAAHLGGMLFGFLLLRYWRKTSNTLY